MDALAKPPQDHLSLAAVEVPGSPIGTYMTQFYRNPDPADDSDMPRAAERHLLDARLLLGTGRYDGAAYLAGYVVECVFKTLIKASDPAFPTTVKHHPHAHLDTAKKGTRPLIDAFNKLLVAPAPHLSKYLTPIILGNSIVPTWSTGQRYQAPIMSVTTATAWIAEADTIFTDTVQAMFLDGIITWP